MKKLKLLAGALLAIMMSVTSIVNAQLIPWYTTGNSGTSVSTNFLGTIVNVALSIRTNNQNRVRITTSGNVGVGTTSPASRLHVYSSASMTALNSAGIVTIGNSATGLRQMKLDANRIQSVLSGVIPLSSSSLLLNPFGGKVGIGYNGEPGSRLYIAADSGERAFWVAINNSTKLMVENNGGTSIGYSSGNTPPVDGLIVNGNVGIGTPSATVKLVVNGEATSLNHMVIKNDGYTNFRFTNNGGLAIGENIPTGTVTTYAPPALGMYIAGDVGIGTTSPNYKLDVCGTMRAKEVRIETGWCDYVFADDYQLRSIEEVEAFINENKHLPGIAPASQVEAEGMKVGEMSKAMMEKIEELTLYLIDQNNQIKELKIQNQLQQQQLNSLKK